MFRDVTARQFVKELARETKEDDIFNGAAALGYYLTLAIFPAMIFLMAVIPYLPIPHVDQAIMDLLRQALPASAAEMFSGVVQQITSEQRGGLLSFGFLGALWATSTGMYAIMQQLNITYDVDEARSFVRARLTAIGLSLLFAVLVLGGFSLIVLGGQIQDWLGSRFGFSEALLSFFVVFRWVIIVLGLLLAFALTYQLAPNVEQRFAFITPGSIVGVVVLMLASLGFAWYTQSFGSYDATYGSIGAVIVLMLWLYIAGLSILIGSEINALIEHHSAEGKEKGEQAPGEAERNPATRQRVREAAPEGGGFASTRKRARESGGRERGSGVQPYAAPPALGRPFLAQSVGGLFGTMLTLAVVAALTGGRRPRPSQRDVALR
jgi:membrane protein